MSNRPSPAPAVAAPTPDLMAHRAPFRPRRNPLRTWSWVAGAVMVLLLAIGATMLAVGREPIARALGMPVSSESPLVFSNITQDHQRRSELLNMLILSGTIANVSGEEQRVPAILAEGIDANGRVIYSWTFPPPERTLAAGDSVRFDNAHSGATDKIVAVRLSFNSPPP